MKFDEIWLKKIWNGDKTKGLKVLNGTQKLAPAH